MSARTIFIESQGDFSSVEKKKITEIAARTYSRSSSLLGLPATVNITFYRFGSKNGGFTQAKDWISVTIPKGKINYVDLEAMLYHELHHIARGYAGYTEGKFKHFLLNSLFSEGLATAFEIDMQPKGRVSTHDKYTARLVRTWLPRTKSELYSTTKYDYASWFHGAGRPKQLGYKLGKYLVDEIRKNHPKLTHKDLVREEAKKLLRLSKVKI